MFINEIIIHKLWHSRNGQYKFDISIIHFQTLLIVMMMVMVVMVMMVMMVVVVVVVHQQSVVLLGRVMFYWT